MQQKATQTGLSLEVFAGALGEGSANLAQMFGGATAGARMFTDPQRNLKGSIPEIMKLGVQMEEICEFTNDYLEIQKIQGSYQGRTAAQLARGTQDILNNLTDLLKLQVMLQENKSQRH